MGLNLSDLEVDIKLQLIQELIPLGLMHVGEVLKEEVRVLAGDRYKRHENGELVSGRLAPILLLSPWMIRFHRSLFHYPRHVLIKTRYREFSLSPSFSHLDKNWR
jgi:hypothetical protein